MAFIPNITMAPEDEVDNVSYYSDDIYYNMSAPRIPVRELDPAMLAHMRYHYYGYPILLVIGTIGNVLSYIVFTRTGLRKVSSLHYLAGIAVTDTGFLWTFIFNPLYRYHGVALIVQAGVCQLMMFLNYVFTFLSIWYLVAMVFEKFIGVFWPLRKCTMCTPFRAKLVMCFMAVIAAACYSYMGYFMGPDKFMGKLQCMPWHELKLHFVNLTKLDTIAVAMLPYTIIIAITSLIVIRGCEYYRISAAVDLWPRQSRTGSTSIQTNIRLTRILLPMILITIITCLPVMVTRTVMIVFEVFYMRLAKLNQIFYEFYIINFADKFFIYIIFSHSFRRKMKNLCLSGYGRIRSTCHASTTNSEFHLAALPKGLCDSRGDCGVKLMYDVKAV